MKSYRKRKYLHIPKFIYIYFSKFQCTSHQPVSVTDFGWRVNHVKLLISLCLQNLYLFLNLLWGGRLQPPPLWVRQWCDLFNIVVYMFRPHVVIFRTNIISISERNKIYLWPQCTPKFLLIFHGQGICVGYRYIKTQKYYHSHLF